MKKLILLCISAFLFICSVNAQIQHLTKVHELDFIIGKWDVEAHVRLSAQGPWDTSKATSVIKKSLNAMIIEEDYIGTKQGKSSYIKATFGYNNANGLLQKMFADSDHGVLVLYEGSKSNDTIYFDKTWTYANGNSVKLRTAYQKVSDSEFVVMGMRMPQGSAVWDVNSRSRYTRAKNITTEMGNPSMFFSAVIVKNIDSSIKWYSNIFNLKQRNRIDNEQRGFKQANVFNDEIFVELIELKKGIAVDSLLKNDLKGSSIHGFKKIGFKVKDIDAWYKHLRTQNVKFRGSLVTDPIDRRRTFIILDPDGNIIQFFE